MDKNGMVPLVVTTEHRGVFFGYAPLPEGAVAEIRLERARMAVYWSQETKGVVGLAASGPARGSRIGPPAPAITLNAVTSVMECSKPAAESWEKEPWS